MSLATIETIESNASSSRFGKGPDGEKGAWLNSLSRVETPPPSRTPEIPARSPLPNVNSPTMNLVHSLKAETQRQQDRISTLESEKRTESERQKSLESSKLFLIHSRYQTLTALYERFAAS